MQNLQTLCCAAILLLFTACASNTFNLPPVTTADGGKSPGKVIWHDLVSDTPVESRRFYSELFGWEFEDLALPGANYALIRNQGRVIGGLVDQNRLPAEADISQWVMVLSVADAEQAAAAVAAGGGAVLTPPTSLGERGVLTVIADPAGAVSALLQSPVDPPDSAAAPRAGDFLWYELWTNELQLAQEFYQALASYEVSARTFATAADVDYRVLTSGGAARLALRSHPVPELHAAWISYLRVADAAALDDILARVPGLGGKVLVPASPRQLGGSMALITGPSGAVLALQTWSDEQRPVTTPGIDR